MSEAAFCCWWGKLGLFDFKPDEQYVRELKGTLQSHYQNDDAQIDEMRGVRFLEEPVPIPEELITVAVEVRDPTITDEIARVVATLTLNDAGIQCVGEEGDKAEKNRTLREKWTKEILHIAGRREPGIPTEKAAVDACVGDGGAWTKLLFTPDTWEVRYGMKLDDYSGDPDKFDEVTEDEKKNAGPPFIWKSVDVRSVYPVWSGGRLTEMIEVTKRPTLPLLRQYGARIDRGRILPARSESDTRSSGSTQELEFVEYWNDKYVAYVLVSGKSAFMTEEMVFEHGYGQVPYFYAPGLMPSYWKGRKVGWGVSQSKLWLVRFKSFLLSMVAQDAARELGKPVGIETPDAGAQLLGPDGKPLTRMDWNVGELFQLNSGQKFVEFPTRAITPALKELLSYISDLIDHLDTPRVQSQIGSGLEGAGFAISQVLTEAKTKHAPFAQHVEMMLEEVTRFLWKLMQIKVKEKVWVRYEDTAGSGKRISKWLAAGPEDLGQGVGVVWTIDPLQPSAKLIESRYHVEQVQSGFESMDQAIEAQGRNPDEVRIGKAYDRIRASKAYQTYEERIVFEDAQRGDIIAEIAEQIARTGTLPNQDQGFDPTQGQGQNPTGSGGLPNQSFQSMTAEANGPQNGSVEGVGPGVVVPIAAATAGIRGDQI